MTIEGVMTLINSICFVLGGIAIFMIGMGMMGDNLERAAGKNIRSLMGKATRNRFAGVATGTAVTALIQSSSATTVMLVGFVNVGLMTLTQAASVIMGANIGTTISAFITALSLGGAEIKIAAIFALVAFVGFFMSLFAKSERTKRIGSILSGLGMIFIGLNVMSSAVGDVTAEGTEVGNAIRSMFASIGNNAEVLTWEVPVLFLIGIAVTGLMQSSSAVTAIIISLASAGLMNLQMAMCVVLGTNIGTCVTAVISSVGTTTNAKRTACVHLLFNIFGCIIFILPVGIWGNQIAGLIETVIPSTEWQIAVFHLFFNLTTTAILVGFLKYLVKLACIIVPDKSKTVQPHPYEILDERLLKSPAIAVGQARQELVKMGQLAFGNYKRSVNMLLTGSMDSKPEFDDTEKEIDALNKYITQFLVRLSLEPLSETDEKKLSSFYHVATDMERVGDYAENITEYAQTLIDNNTRFSEHAVEEIKDMDATLTELYRYVEMAFSAHNLSYTQNIENAEARTDEICRQMQLSHIRRTNEGSCSPEAGSVFLQLAVNMERIGDHMYNIANSIKTYVSDQEGA